MKAIVIGIVILIVGGASLFFLKTQNPQLSSESTTNSNPLASGTFSPEKNDEHVTVIAQNLDTPWAMAFLPNGDLLITERKGTVRKITNGQLKSNPVATIKNAKESGEGGLLGMTLHPDFAKNNFIYFYYTYQETGSNTLNRVVQVTYANDQLTNEATVLDAIPGASNHNGGRIAFGPDGFLYITTGDAQEPSRAQDTKSLAGKILRVTAEGKPAPGNPFGNEVYSYGHRNPQGITWDSTGQLWATEHGRSGVQSGLDELNKIMPGKNYGWPTIEGDKTQAGMEKPFAHSGGNTTWAPGAVAFVNGSLFFGGLRGQTLYENKINSANIIDHFKDKFGRIREVVRGPDNMLYISTSNQDGRGSVKPGDDKILKINPSQL